MSKENPQAEKVLGVEGAQMADVAEAHRGLLETALIKYDDLGESISTGLENAAQEHLGSKYWAWVIPGVTIRRLWQKAVGDPRDLAGAYAELAPALLTGGITGGGAKSVAKKAVSFIK